MQARRPQVSTLAYVCLAFSVLLASHANADESAVASTRDRAAEHAYDEIEALPIDDPSAIEEAGRRFLVRFPRDPLAPRVELLVGRAIVVSLFAAAENGESANLDAARLEQGVAWLARAEAHADAPTLDRVRLFRSAALALRGQDAEAAALAEPLEASLTLPEDRTFHTRVTLGACSRAGRTECVLHALDELRRACRDESECAAVDDRIAQYTGASVDDDAAIRFARSAAPTRSTFAAIAGRAIRAAALANDWESVRAIAERAARASVELDAESRELARRLEFGRSADARVVGVVAGLSGPDAEASMALVSAIARAAGLPPNGPLPRDAFRIVVRDHRGDPDEAARAISELYWLHRAVAVIGPLDAPSATSAAERAERLGLPFLSLAPITPGSFTLDASPSTSSAWLRHEVERRFGAGIGLVAPTGARAGTTYGPDVFPHAGGRFDAATRTRLSRSTVPALLLVARPAEVTRLAASVDLALRSRRRSGRPVVVLDRRAFEQIVSHGRGRSIEGALVLERVTSSSASEGPSPTAGAGETAGEEARAGAAAFERIERAGASTRELLAARLALPGETVDRSAVRAYQVRRATLVPVE